VAESSQGTGASRTGLAGNEAAHPVSVFDRQMPPFFAIVETLPGDRFLRLSTTEEDVGAFLDALKKAVKERDHEALANAMNYPLVVTRGKEHIEMIVHDPTEFGANYDRIMVESVVAAIRRATTKTAGIPSQGITLGAGVDCMVNYMGISIGAGRIWFDPARVDQDGMSRLLIRAIDVEPSR
jgi:hypothetical protein